MAVKTKREGDQSLSGQKFPYEDHLLTLKPGQEEIIFIKDKAFVVSAATEDDIERIKKGFFVMD